MGKKELRQINLSQVTGFYLYFIILQIQRHTFI